MILDPSATPHEVHKKLSNWNIFDQTEYETKPYFTVRAG